MAGNIFKVARNEKKKLVDVEKFLQQVFFLNLTNKFMMIFCLFLFVCFFVCWLVFIWGRDFLNDVCNFHDLFFAKTSRQEVNELGKYLGKKKSPGFRKMVNAKKIFFLSSGNSLSLPLIKIRKETRIKNQNFSRN